MKKFLILLIFFTIACGPSEAEIQERIEEFGKDTTALPEDNTINSEENNINKDNCYEWLGSSNYFGCIQGFEVSLLKTIKDIGGFDS